ncbi:MAG: glycosyltransferase family 1 protein [Solirubrobacterales bacterium]|nr:glycosyltransferase family 1 protein [Solirubrobacterales bacterium]
MSNPRVRRVMLACSLGGEGHLVPLARVGRAVQAAGHEVKLLVPPALADSARRTGLAYRVGEEPPRAFVDEIWQRVRAGPAEAVAGLFDRELFADRCTEAMLGAARDLRDSWRPQFVVREPCEYASAVAAHETGIPHAEVGVSLASIESGVLRMVAPIIERFSPGVAAAIASSPYLSSFPTSLDPSPWSDTRRFRAAAARRNVTSGPARDREQPLVYVTFGSVLGHLPEASAVFRCALEAVAGLPARVLLTVGRATDVPSLGSIPENTRVEQWVPQDVVLEHAAVVVCHGGSGTTFGALAAGVPLVVCPLFADQLTNARIVQDSGAGMVLGGHTPASGGLGRLGPNDVAPLRARIEEVLGTPSYRHAASRIAAEIAALPTLQDVVRRLI